VPDDDLSISRPLDDVTAAHLNRTFADRTGADRRLGCRIHALTLSIQYDREYLRLDIRVGPDGEVIRATELDVEHRVLDRAERFADWLGQPDGEAARGR
jgi:hypothetical protein